MTKHIATQLLEQHISARDNIFIPMKECGTGKTKRKDTEPKGFRLVKATDAETKGLQITEIPDGWEKSGEAGMSKAGVHDRKVFIVAGKDGFEVRVQINDPRDPIARTAGSVGEALGDTFDDLASAVKYADEILAAKDELTQK